MPPESPAEFVRLLRDLELIEPAQHAELDRLAAAAGEVRPLVKALAGRGWLTLWQAQAIFNGRGGDLVMGSYLLLDLIGEGGMGTVYRARHRMMGRVVALKVIRKERLAHPDAVRRFQREIQAAAQLSHPNVVLAYDADRAGDVHYFAMEFVEGVDLGRTVRENGPLPAAQACEYARQAALGLQHAHERGLIHRDVKPSNLLLTMSRPEAVRAALGGVLSVRALGESETRGVIKILDMGLARVAEPGSGEQPSHLTQEGLIIGTPDFVAPEQARNASKVDIRADVYGLGCTLFYLLTGQPPYPGGTPTEKLLKQAVDPIPSATAVRPGLPAGLDAILAKAMAKKPDDRFQTPAEFAAALEPFTPDAGAARIAGTHAPTTAELVVSDPSTASKFRVPMETLAQLEVERRRQFASDDRRQLIWVAAALAGMVLLGLLGLLTAMLVLGG